MISPDPRRPRRHHDDARRQIDRLLDRVRDQHHRLALRPQARRAAGPASRSASARRARRTARPSAGTPASPHRRARSPAAGACRRTSVLRIRVGEVGQAHQPHVARADRVALAASAAVRARASARTRCSARPSATGTRRIPGRSRRDRGRARRPARPSSVHAPAVGCTNPATMFIIVVLPQPDGPISDTNSPWRIVEADVVDDAHRAGAPKRDRHAIEGDANRRRLQWHSRDALLPATSRRDTARSATSIASAMKPMQMMPT